MSKKIFDFTFELICLICVGMIFIYLFENRDTKVTRVVDGDTFITNRGDRVRLIGVDAPELPTLEGIESKMYLDKLIDDKVVILKGDEISNNKDKYGRLLRYVIKSLALAVMLYTPQVDSVSNEIYMASLEIVSDMAKEISNKNFVKSEIIITLEDLSEWMRNDIDNETIDPRLAEIYIDNFDKLIKQVKEL